MRIAWIHSFAYGETGSGIFMHRLAAAMRAASFDVELFYTGDIRSPLRLRRSLERLRRETAECDLVHAQYGSGCGFVASLLRGPRVLTLRGSDWYGFAGGPSRKAHGSLARWITRRSIPKFDRVIVMSERMRRELAIAFGESKLRLIPDGLDLNQFRPMDRQHARECLGYGGDDAPWVLYSSLAMRNPIKRPELAMAAVQQARASIPRLRLIEMTGVEPDRVPLYINACDVVLLTSTHEGWPNIIKEGLACGVPFVATDVSDLAAIAQLAPSCKVTASEPAALAASLVDAVLRPRTSDLRQFVAGMSLDIVAQDLGAVYEELISGISKAPGR